MARLRTILLIFILLSCIGGISFLILLQKQIIPLPTHPIQGVILDLGNQPISGVPFMLYEGSADINSSNDCLYTCVSNKSGHFFFPKPIRDGNYFLVTILDKERLLLPTIQIAPKSNYIDLQIIYYASHYEKKPPELVVSSNKSAAQNTAKKPVVPPPLNLTNKGIPKGAIAGKVYLENKQLFNAGTLELICENLESGISNSYKIDVKNGNYELRDILPGIYQFKANIPNYSTVSGLEMFILENQVAQMDIQFQKSTNKIKPANTQKGVEVSVTVIDASWTPQVGAQVTLVSRENGQGYDGQTDENGEMIFHNIPAGDYEVRAIFNGLRGRCELQEELSASSGKFVSLVLREIE